MRTGLSLPFRGLRRIRRTLRCGTCLSAHFSGFRRRATRFAGFTGRLTGIGNDRVQRSIALGAHFLFHSAKQIEVRFENLQQDGVLFVSAWSRLSTPSSRRVTTASATADVADGRLHHRQRALELLDDAGQATNLLVQRGIRGSMLTGEITRVFKQLVDGVGHTLTCRGAVFVLAHALGKGLIYDAGHVAANLIAIDDPDLFAAIAFGQGVEINLRTGPVERAFKGVVKLSADLAGRGTVGRYWRCRNTGRL